MSARERLKSFLQIILDVIEDLVSIAIAAGILIYGWFVDQGIYDNAALLWSGVIMILTVMAIGNLRDRRSRFTRINSAVEETLNEVRGNKIYQVAGADKFFVADEDKIQVSLAASHSIDILGITLSTSVGRMLNLLRDRLRSHGKMRIIILDGESEAALEQLVKRSWSKKASKEKYLAILENTSDLLQEVGKEQGLNGSFEIGYLPFIPSIGLTLVDQSRPDAVGIVTFYHQLKKDNPSFLISKVDDPNTFDRYQDQFELMWNECKANRLVKVA